MTDDLIKRLRDEGHLWRSDRIEAADRIEAQAAEIARLSEALSAVWKEASTMRGASKLVGPYPNEIGKHRIWARSMYHAGKRIMELLKPARQPAQH